MNKYKVLCENEIHHLGLDGDGEVHILNHDIEEEETLDAMGLPVSECFYLYQRLITDIDNALVCSVESEHRPDWINLCLDAGADIHYRNNFMLRIACTWGDYPVARVLVERGANVNCQSEFTIGDSDKTQYYMQTPLYNARLHQNEQIVSLLKEAGATNWGGSRTEWHDEDS